MARPKIKIDLDVLEKLCSVMCTDEELAAVFKCSAKTIQNRKKNKKFLEAMERGKGVAKANLRKKQFSKAMNGDTKMLIWLGKQYLEQEDKRTIDSDDLMTPLVLEVHNDDSDDTDNNTS